MLDALCARAREALPDGGTITITTAPRRDRPAGGDPPASTTPGPADPPRTSRPSLRALPPAPGGGKGQGLGMSRRRRPPPGGWAESVSVRSGDGTTIDGLFPAARRRARRMARHGPPKPGPRLPAARAPRRPRRATILLAEDDEGLRDLAVKVLSREGYDVLAARDGQEAVEAVRAHPRRASASPSWTT